MPPRSHPHPHQPHAPSITHLCQTDHTSLIAQSHAHCHQPPAPSSASVQTKNMRKTNTDSRSLRHGSSIFKFSMIAHHATPLPSGLHACNLNFTKKNMRWRKALAQYLPPPRQLLCFCHPPMGLNALSYTPVISDLVPTHVVEIHKKKEWRFCGRLSALDLLMEVESSP